MSDEALFVSEVRKLEEAAPYLKLDLDWNTGVAMLACLQLSLRHPGNRGESAALVRGLCDDLIAGIERIRPKLAELLRRGDDPGHDI